MIEFYEIPLGEGGAGCARCGRGGDARYSPAEEILTELAGLSGSTAASGVAFVGPDALGHDSLLDLVRAAVGAGVARVRVDVDAADLADASEDLIGSGVHHVRAWTSGDSAVLSDGLSAFRKAAEAASVRIATSVLVPVCRHDVQTAPTAVMQAVEAKADSVLLRVEDGGLDSASALPWLTAACDTGMVNATWVEIEGVPFCLLSGHELHLANVVRSCAGAKADGCNSCAVDPWCDGLTVGAAPASLESLDPSAVSETLARSLEKARTGVRT